MSQWDGWEPSRVSVTWFFVAFFLGAPMIQGWMPVSTVIHVGEQIPLEGTVGQTISEQPYSPASEFVLVNDTPFSSSSGKWSIQRTEQGNIDYAWRYVDVAVVNLTQLLCCARIHVIHGPAEVFLSLGWSVNDTRISESANTDDTMTLSLALSMQSIRNQTSSSVVRFSASIALGFRSDIHEPIFDILGFCTQGTYNDTMSPVVFDVKTTDGESLFSGGKTEPLLLGSVAVNITNCESEIPFFFRVEQSNKTLFLPHGNYSGLCYWDPRSYTTSLSISACLYADSTTQWSIRLPSARVHLDFAPRIPNCLVHIETWQTGAEVSSTSADILLRPEAWVSLAAKMRDETGWRTEPSSTFDFQLEGAVEINITIETPYITLGPIALLPITILLTAGLSSCVLLLVFWNRKELRTGIWHNLSARPGVPSFLLLVLSVLLPWPLNWAAPSNGLYAGIPGIMQSFWSNQQDIIVVTALPVWILFISCLLWAAAAIASTGIKKEDDERLLAALLITFFAVILGLMPAIAVSFTPEFISLAEAPYGLLGPTSAIGAIVSRFLVQCFVKNRRL